MEVQMRTLSHVARQLCVVAILSAGPATTATGQTIGPVSWQLQPYCNVVSISATPVGSTYRLEGFDDQCGAATQASVIGTAFLNPNGTIGLGFNIVATPGGALVHVDATLTLPALTGVWQDSLGGAGTFAFGPPAGGLPPRPVGPTGPTVMTIVPGPGLAGGGSASTVNVGVSFAGSGAASTVAHSDHTHAVPGTANTAVGDGAMASNVNGTFNTAFGFNALASSTATTSNVAVGANALSLVNAPGSGFNVAIGNLALSSLTSGCCNVAVGGHAMRQTTTGQNNIAIGTFALLDNTSGGGNVAIGHDALNDLTGAANNNIAIGDEAGVNVVGASESIFIGNAGMAADDLVIKIGTNQTRTFIAGIHSGTVSAVTDMAVLVDSTGRLGTVASSARFKTNVADIGTQSKDWLHRLRPVSFQYLPELGRGTQRQFGLIAEEVAEVLPELVVNDENGKPYTIKYHVLQPLLLAEIQRLERERRAQEDRIAEQTRELAALRALVQTLIDARR